MTRGTDGLFRPADGDLPADPKARLQAGALEGSNVSPVETMVAMIAAARQFEQQMKMLQSADQKEQTATKLLATVLHYILPNFGNFNIQNKLIHPEQTISNPNVFIFQNVVYAIIYSAVLLLLPILVFAFDLPVTYAEARIREMIPVNGYQAGMWCDVILFLILGSIWWFFIGALIRWTVASIWARIVR